MEEKFGGLPVLDYFLAASAKNIDLYFKYYRCKRVLSSKFKNIYFPTDADANTGEKLLCVISCLNAEWDLGFFKRVGSMLNDKEIVEMATSSLPSIFLSGM